MPVPALFWLILAAGLALHIAFAAGLSGNDDLAIGFNAIRVMQDGFFLPVGHYEARFGLTVPLAGVFAALGVGAWQLILLPMLASMLGIVLAYNIGAHLFGRTVGLWAAASLAAYPMDVEFAGVFFPDNVQGTLLAAAFWLALRGEDSTARSRSAVAAGLIWAWAYYVKIDSFVMAAVFGLAWLLGYLSFMRMLLIGFTALGAVSVEFLIYARLAGDPLWHMALDRRAANEMLAASRDYRDSFTYPKAMFVTVYQTGVQYFLAVAAFVLMFARRERATLLIAGWVLIFHAWLAFGMDPFGETLRLKPQLVRYLEVYAIPLAVLVGWFLAFAYARISRLLTVLGCAGGIALALLCMAFNSLNYQAARASTIATETALRNNWFPLYTEVQSIQVAHFLLHDGPHERDVRAVQQHDFLTGTTRFGTIMEPVAYLLINEEYASRLQRRNLVEPIVPERFSMRVTQVLSVDRPSPALSYAALRVLVTLANLVPVPALRERVNETAREVTAPGRAKIYRLER